MTSTSRRRVAVAALMFETNSFAPGRTTLADFDRGTVRGAELFRVGGGLDSVAGAAAVAADAGVELVPLLGSYGLSGPVVESGATEVLIARVVDALSEVLADIDGVYLSLHGAMVAEDCEDVEGLLLTRVRELVGPEMPIAYSADLHAHFTAAMAAATPLVAGYRTLPHVDIRETGERAMRLLVATLDGARPVIGWRKVAMMTSAEGQDTTVAPMSEVMARVVELDSDPIVLDSCVFATQPWLDVTELGWSSVVIVDGESGQARASRWAQRHADELGHMVWERREQITAPKTSAAEAFAAVRSAIGGPVILSDGADSVSGGGTGDGVQILRALLAEAEPVPGPFLMVVTDAAVAAELTAAGVGATRTVTVGARLAPRFHEPVEVTGRVSIVTDGRYQSLYPPARADVGPTAVLVIDDRIHLVVTTRPASQLDHEVYRHVGWDIRQARAVVAKSAGGYKAHYGPLAVTCIDVDTTGPCDSRLDRLPFTRPARPLWPFDPALEKPWPPTPS